MGAGPPMRGGAGPAALASAVLLLCTSPGRPASTCWVGGYSRELCCDPQHGPRGNAACWDDVFRYDPCCTDVDALESGGAVGSNAVGVQRPQEADILEHSLGAKLDASLAENNSTLASMEEDLRRTIERPENRSMAGPVTHAYLALVLYRQGRYAEAHTEFERFMGFSGEWLPDPRRVAPGQANDFAISDNGAWSGASAAGYHMHDGPFSEALTSFFRDRGARTVVDLGCGLGLYVRDLRAAGLRAGGFDGNPSTSEITAGRCQQLDLSREVDFGVRWDWVLSLEVAEHIPKHLEEQFVGNLVRHACFGMVVSWGNQAGEGHVNLKPRHEVEAIFAAHGFRSEPVAAAALREAARLPWLRSTVMVFDRTSVPADCGSGGAAGPGAVM